MKAIYGVFLHDLRTTYGLKPWNPKSFPNKPLFCCMPNLSSFKTSVCRPTSILFYMYNKETNSRTRLPIKLERYMQPLTGLPGWYWKLCGTTTKIAKKLQKTHENRCKKCKKRTQTQTNCRKRRNCLRRFRQFVCVLAKFFVHFLHFCINKYIYYSFKLSSCIVDLL
jgi:hypothetical protein